MDVGDWLRSFGLGQYETLLRQNDIDVEVLGELTEGDLEKFGVSFGHRKRLLKAIASLASTETTAKRAAPIALQTIHGRCRAPAAHGDVLRSGRLDRAAGPARSRRLARDHRRVSSLLRGGHRALRRFRRRSQNSLPDARETDAALLRLAAH
jgi:hypothetical protein